MASVNLRTVFAFAREMHSKNPNVGNIQYGELRNFSAMLAFDDLFHFSLIKALLDFAHCE